MTAKSKHPCTSINGRRVDRGERVLGLKLNGADTFSAEISEGSARRREENGTGKGEAIQGPRARKGD